MSDSIYELAINRAVDYGINEISLNHYSEPTLNFSLSRRITQAAANGLTVTLFSNGSNLSASLVNKITSVSTHLQVVINLPEATPTAHQETTQSKTFSTIISNIKYAQNHLPLKIVVNNKDSQVVKQLSSMFSNVEVQHWETDDRAGEIYLPQLTKARKHKHLLNGCPLSIRYLNVGVEGKVFQCAQDFKKKYVLGDICKNSLVEIINSEKSKQLRGWIFGINKPPEDFICTSCRWTQARRNDYTIGAELN
tara:strand:+ start:139 stop:891 length:753 start_codon:yes stop_codon:yes gene_type:complete